MCVGRARRSRPGRSLAHTELEFSLPANGTTVGEPVEEITVGFTDVVALVGNGFEVHDPQGNLLTPFVVTDDNKVFRFQLDPPLAGGVVVVDYHMRSLDGDEVQGQVSFIAAAEPPPPATPAPTTEPTTPPVTAPPTGPPATDPAVTGPVATTGAPSPSTLVPTSSGPPSTAVVTTADDVDGDDSSDSNRNLLIGVIVAVVIGSAVVLVVRSRRTP